MSASLADLPVDLLVHQIFPHLPLPCSISCKSVSRTFRKHATREAAKFLNREFIMGDRYRSQDAILQQLGHRHFSTSYLLWFKNVLNFPITQPRNFRLLGAGNHLPLLQTLFSKFNDIQYYASIPGMASRVGNLETLKWLHSINVPIRSNCISTAALYGQIETLNWLLDIGIEIPKEAPQEAAVGGHVQILEIFKKANVRMYLSGSTHKPVLEWMLANKYRVDGHFTTLVGQTGDLPLVKWAVQQKNLGLCKDETLCSAAASCGSLEMLRWLREEAKLPWDYNVARLASHEGHLSILKYYHANDKLSDRDRKHLTSYVAASGNLEMLQWMHTNGYPIIPYTFQRAASSKHKNSLLILQWLHANCPLVVLDEMDQAASSGDLERVKWLASIGVPVLDSTLTQAVPTGSLELCKWIAETRPSSNLITASHTAASWNWSLILAWLVEEKKCLLTGELWRAAKGRSRVEAILRRNKCPQG